MTEQEYEEMMLEITNDPDYNALEAAREQETMEMQGRLTDAEIAELYGEIK